MHFCNRKTFCTEEITKTKSKDENTSDKWEDDLPRNNLNRSDKIRIPKWTALSVVDWLSGNDRGGGSSYDKAWDMAWKTGKNFVRDGPSRFSEIVCGSFIASGASKKDYLHFWSNVWDI